MRNRYYSVLILSRLPINIVIQPLDFQLLDIQRCKVTNIDIDELRSYLDCIVRHLNLDTKSSALFMWCGKGCFV